MAKIPFTLDAWLKDKSQRVETRDGLAVTDIHLTKYRDENVVVYYVGRDMWICGEEGNVNIDKTECKYDLFIVTPEEELTEYEKCLGFAMGFSLNDMEENRDGVIKHIKDTAKELLALARDQFIKEGYVIQKKAFHDAVEKVTPEVMKEVSDKVDMKEALRLEYERGKAEALKDLPRWREWGNGAAGNSDGHPIALVSGAGGIRFVSVLGVIGEKYIMLDDLKKLPGFKEDEK